MKNYTIYCTTEQVQIALELGAPIEYEFGYVNGIPYKITDEEGEPSLIIPTAEQMIGWLRKEMKLAISIGYNIQNDNTPVWFYSIFNVAYSNTFSEPEEATLAAIDAALDYLEKQNVKK